MFYILDTNILIALIRENAVVKMELAKMGAFQPQNTTSISIASVGEILSFALQNNWGNTKRNNLEALIARLKPIPIAKRDLVDAYAEIDTYSKG
jgi:tRNA(fMet)-specific endonuclease VapC